MTTLGTMKDRIYAETRRGGGNAVWAAAVASAISTAIDAYRTERFAFKEKRSVTVATVSGQEFYTSGLSNLEKIDYVHLIIGSQPYSLTLRDAEWMERASVGATQTGQPTDYAWYELQLRVWPVPNSSNWTLRVAGNYHIAAPASDIEAGNPWMNAAETLIRSRAKYELFEHVLYDDVMAERFHPDLESSPTGRALKILRSKNTLLTGSGIIAPFAM